MKNYFTIFLDIFPKIAKKKTKKKTANRSFTELHYNILFEKMVDGNSC